MLRAAEPEAPVEAAKTTKPVETPAPKSTRYEYYQSKEKMTVSVLAKNLSREDVEVTIEPTRLRVLVRINGVAEVVVDKQLFAEVDVASSYFEVKRPKVEVVLLKAVPDSWPHLEGDGRASYIKAVRADEDAAAPSSSRPKAYASHRDWDSLGSEISKELDAEKPEGEAALQKVSRARSALHSLPSFYSSSLISTRTRTLTRSAR